MHAAWVCFFYESNVKNGYSDQIDCCSFFIEVMNMKTIRTAVYCRVSSNKRIQMHGIEAQQKSVNKSNHIKWGLEAGYRSGSSGLAKRICYGYKKDESGELIICPEQAEIVQLIYELYLSGYSLSGIAKELRERGIVSPTGKHVMKTKDN